VSFPVRTCSTRLVSTIGLGPCWLGAPTALHGNMRKFSQNIENYSAICPATPYYLPSDTLGAAGGEAGIVSVVSSPAVGAPSTLRHMCQYDTVRECGRWDAVQLHTGAFTHASNTGFLYNIGFLYGSQPIY
jgi:hypothetical protein